MWTIEDYCLASNGNESTKALYRRLLTKMEKMLGKPLAKATLRDLATLKAKLRLMKSGLYFANLLGGFYHKMGRQDLAAASYLHIKRPRLSPDQILSPDEVNRLINAGLTMRDQALIGAVYESGGRISELLHVRLKDVKEIDPASNGGLGGFSLWLGKVKVTGQEHYSFVIDSALLLRKWIANHPFPEPDRALFCTVSGKGLERKGAWRRIKDAAKRAEITKRTYPHLLRHSRASHLLAQGVPESSVKVLLGWTPSSRMLDNYSHIGNDSAYRALLKGTKGVTFGDDAASKFTYKPVFLPPIPVKPIYGAAKGHSQKVVGEIFSDLAGLKENMADLQDNIAGLAKANRDLVAMNQELIRRIEQLGTPSS
jgi:site-specific recombinase XerD